MIAFLVCDSGSNLYYLNIQFRGVPDRGWESEAKEVAELLFWPVKEY